MQVEYLWSKDCPKCNKLKETGIVDDIYRVLAPLPDVHWLSEPVGSVGRTRLKIVNGEPMKETPQFTGMGIDRFVERRGDKEMGTPMFHLVTDEVYAEETFPDIVADSMDEMLELMQSTPRYVAHLVLRRIFQFYVRRELGLPRSAAGRIGRNHPPDAYSELNWVNAFSEAKTA